MVKDNLHYYGYLDSIMSASTFAYLDLDVGKSTLTRHLRKRPSDWYILKYLYVWCNVRPYSLEGIYVRSSRHQEKAQTNTHMNPNTAPKNSAPYVLSSAGIGRIAAAFDNSTIASAMVSDARG